MDQLNQHIRERILSRLASCASGVGFEEQTMARFTELLDSKGADAKAIQAKFKQFVGESTYRHDMVVDMCANIIDSYGDSEEKNEYGEVVTPNCCRTTYSDMTDLVTNALEEIGNLSEMEFLNTVNAVMAENGLDLDDVRKNTKMDRRVWERLMRFEEPIRSRHNVWHLIIGLHCTEKQAKRVLRSVGFAPRKNNAFDTICLLCLEHRFYDIGDINILLENAGLTRPFQTK